MRRRMVPGRHAAYFPSFFFDGPAFRSPPDTYPKDFFTLLRISTGQPTFPPRGKIRGNETKLGSSNGRELNLDGGAPPVKG